MVRQADGVWKSVATGLFADIEAIEGDPRGVLIAFHKVDDRNLSPEEGWCLGWIDPGSGGWGWAPAKGILSEIRASVLDHNRLYLAGGPPSGGHGFVAAFDAAEILRAKPDGVWP